VVLDLLFAFNGSKPRAAQGFRSIPYSLSHDLQGIAASAE
jgi:hypothetical protein